MDFYCKYVHLCNSVNKTPSAVAQEIGISKSLVSRWKRGGGATDAVKERIANYFSCSISDLNGEGEQKEKPTENGELSAARQALLDSVDGLSEDQIYKYLEIIEKVKSL